MHPIIQEIQSIRSGDREVKGFARLMGAVAAVVSLFLFWRNGWTVSEATYWILGVGTAVFAAGTIAPSVLRPVHRLWMGLAVVLGYIVTRVLLGLVFYLVVTPIGLVFKLIGKDPMHRRPDAERSSYWISRTDEEPMDRRMTRYY